MNYKKFPLLIIVINVLLILIINIIYNYFNSKTIEDFENIYNKDIPKSMKIYCINLDKDKQRWNTIKNTSDKYNLDIIRIPAYYGKDVNENEYIRKNILDKNHKLLKGQLGCALSHVELWRKIKNDNEDFALILEDDVQFTDNFKEKLDDLLHCLPETWDIIYLGGCNLYGKKYNEKLMYPTKFGARYNLCCHAMLLNKERIGGLIDIMTPIKYAIDGQLRQNFKNLEVYFVNPNMILQNKEIRSSRRDIDGLSQSEYWKEHHTDITLENFTNYKKSTIKN
jgi:GR25 family glycosyltransferase involved in LPS biosynthesis